jgi:transmembrane sensor
VKNRKYTLLEIINDPSFIRWATGGADSIEAERWNEWVESSEEYRKLAVKAQKRITGIKFETPSALHREEDWKQIEQQILAKKKTVNFYPAQKRGSDSLSVFLKVAAVFLIVALSGLITLYMSGDANIGEESQVSVQSISTDFSEKRTISLSDGSEIILASGTVLSYKEDWLSQPTLRVTLEKGEAYFSIQPDENRDQTNPRFEVVTEDGITAVLGTRFSVSTYGDGTQVVLEQGEVQVRSVETEEAQPSFVTLTPGEMAQWTKQQSGITLSEVNPRVYTSWAFDHLYFDQTPLSYLAERIERTYGVDVEVEDPSLLDLKLSGAVDFYTLDALIHAVSEVLDIRIRQINDRIVIEKMNS